MTPYEEWKRSAWEQAHKKGDISALTGTFFEPHLGVLGCRELFRPDSCVLCIGIGTGEWVRECATRAREVWALDVAPAAGATVGDVATFVEAEPWPNLPVNYFDLAMSHYVAPHMSNHDLEAQLCAVIPSLKTDGVLAMSYKEPLTSTQPVDNREGEPWEAVLAMEAGVLRRRSHFQEMVDWAGGKVVKIISEQPSELYRMIEVSVHVARQA